MQSKLKLRYSVRQSNVHHEKSQLGSHRLGKYQQTILSKQLIPVVRSNAAKGLLKIEIEKRRLQKKTLISYKNTSSHKVTRFPKIFRPYFNKAWNFHLKPLCNCVTQPVINQELSYVYWSKMYSRDWTVLLSFRLFRHRA